MSNAIMYASFKLASGASVSDFLQVSEKLHREFMSKQKGFISWKQLVDGDVWADLLTWETMDDAKNVMAASYTDAVAQEFFSFLDMESVEARFFSVERSY